MTTQINAITGFLSALASAIFGSKFCIFLGEVVTSNDMPIWMQYLLGPLGALVGLIIALIWMNKRLDRAELKNDARESERDTDRKELIQVLDRTNAVIDRSNRIHEKTEAAINNCIQRKQQ